MDENHRFSVTDQLETIAVRFVADVESSLAARGLDPFSWSAVTVTAALHVSGTDPDVFYVDRDGCDHPVASKFDGDLFAVGNHVDSDAITISVHIRNTLDTTGEYDITAELGYRTETGVLEYVNMPADLAGTSADG